jgi:hypothetical protein
MSELDRIKKQLAAVTAERDALREHMGTSRANNMAEENRLRTLAFDAESELAAERAAHADTRARLGVAVEALREMIARIQRARFDIESINVILQRQGYHPCTLLQREFEELPVRPDIAAILAATGDGTGESESGGAS